MRVCEACVCPLWHCEGCVCVLQLATTDVAPYAGNWLATLSSAGSRLYCTNKWLQHGALLHQLHIAVLCIVLCCCTTILCIATALGTTNVVRFCLLLRIGYQILVECVTKYQSSQRSISAKFSFLFITAEQACDKRDPLARFRHNCTTLGKT